jgi:hypothetical protein
MTNTLRNLIHGTRSLERRLTTAVEQAAHTIAGEVEPTPLELVDQACDDIARHVQPAGRGRYAFPFNAVTITFLAPSAERQAHFDGICAGPPSIEERVMTRLTSAGCGALDLDVNVAFTAAPEATWTHPSFHIALARVAPAARTSREPSLHLTVEILHGVADQAAYTFTSLPVTIGRGAEVRDSRHQLLRVNHVAFTENGGDVNQSVSRRHARIEMDPQTDRPRLIDDNSAQGTSVIRGGRGIGVPRGSRGLALQPGDEIVLGHGRLRVTFTASR